MPAQLSTLGRPHPPVASLRPASGYTCVKSLVSASRGSLLFLSITDPSAPATRCVEAIIVMEDTKGGSTVTVDLTFLKPSPLYDEEKPYFIEGVPPKGVRQTNIEYATVETVLHNARGHEQDFDLETHAFEWIHHEYPHTIREERDVDAYMRAMEEVLRQRLKATRVHCYDYTVLKPSARNSW
jgi:hypothetical protein